MVVDASGGLLEGRTVVVTGAGSGIGAATAAAALAATTPLPRFAAPAEIAAQIVHMLSWRSGFITGADLRIDGGHGIA